jgi:hypothetical protein
MRVGITGTREGMSQHQKEQFVLKLLELQPTEFHHGDCLGADAEGHDSVREFFPDCKIHVHPPIKDYMRAFRQGDVMYEPDDYIPRDYRIVDMTEFLIGAPLTDKEIVRSGTWTTIRYAKRIGRNHEVLKR